MSVHVAVVLWLEFSYGAHNNKGHYYLELIWNIPPYVYFLLYYNTCRRRLILPSANRLWNSDIPAVMLVTRSI
jgi:hypothetical protein